MEKQKGLTTANLLKRINPEGLEMEFSNDGKKWYCAGLVGFICGQDKPFITIKPNAKQKYSYKFMREVPPAPKLTREEAEARFKIKIID